MLDDAALARISRALTERGVIVLPRALPADLIRALLAEAEALEARGAWLTAAVGRAGDRRVDAEIRSDRIAWIDAATSPAQAALLAGLGALLVHLRRTLFLAVAEVEAHFARFEPGAYYTRHLDRFRHRGARLVSTVLYLNEGWEPADGGALRIFDPAEPGRVLEEVAPVIGTFCVFLSDSMWHEVLPTRRRRLSVAAWLREAPTRV